ncbi:MAG: hypothetical protein ABSE06_20260 [Anaerolineaceae bacterium]|jgi:hypothetical protein
MTGTGGSFFFSEAVIVGRFLGVMPINYVDGDFGSSNTAIGFTVQLNEYQRVVLVMPLNIQTRYFNLVKDNDVPSPETIFSGHNGYVLKPPTAENFYRILSEISIGTRAYFTIPHNYPDALKNESDTWIKRDSVQTPFAESIENGLPPTIPVVDGKIGVFFIDAFGFPIEIQDILK